MGLEPLEFAECLTDSPGFREKLHDHEKELERTSKAIKALISDGKDVLAASKNLGKACKGFAQKLRDFKFECIGEKLTDDEARIAGSLAEFGTLIANVEEERERMLQQAQEHFTALETFRKQQINSIKDEKRQFDKNTAKTCQSLERYLNLKAKMNDNTLQEADAQLDLEIRGFREASMKYVLKVQEVQERKKFDFIETILAFMYSLFTFYHQGYEFNIELKDYSQNLQKTLQKTRDSFNSQKEYTENLMLKMLDNRKPITQAKGGCTREGYLYLMEKKNYRASKWMPKQAKDLTEALGTTWIKHYCWYKKENKELHILPYNQVTGKLSQSTTEKLTMTSCVRRASQTIDKRFCFDVQVADRTDTLTFQAMSESDRRLWMDAMDGREPVYIKPKTTTDDSSLDDIGFQFVNKCIKAIEDRGLEENGLYRVVGVNSKVNKLISIGLDPKKREKMNLDDNTQFEIKTITSAIKNYLRSLPEPLMTYKFHSQFIQAAKQEAKTLRIHDIHTLVHKLPEKNFEMLEIIIKHLKTVSEFQDKNLMTVANLGVCFGPTLMKAEEETVAAIMDIKFLNIVVEILINNYEQIFQSTPDEPEIGDTKVVPNSKRTIITDRFTPGVNHTMLTANTQSPTTSQPVYANKAPPPPTEKFRPIDKPIEFYNPAMAESSSGSSESINSSQSNHLSNSLPMSENPRKPVNMYGNAGVPEYGNVNALANRFALNIAGADNPMFGSVKKRGTHDTPYVSMNSSGLSMTGSLTGSLTGSIASNQTKPRPIKRTVRTLYRCEAENDSELSFEPNQLIFNVRASKEPGWLEGQLNGKTGLVPENYVEYID
ncbi:rho GTPase-activating protein 26-like isoform X2 [Mytilus californianus]|uniref:rho GTPase-activating protein 26-like isoform X2 n=1 Tax=Mytilus californianus TaxID=6549 RepID=UPI00224716A9|nr:rho GTPase-activating protein 26-like isoform X2 [Mytilus californianus]